MSKRCWPWLFVTALVWVVTPLSVRAEVPDHRNQSHGPVKELENSPDAVQLFDRNLRRAQLRADLQKQLQGRFSADQIQSVIQKLKQQGYDLNDPESLKELAKRFNVPIEPEHKPQDIQKPPRQIQPPHFPPKPKPPEKNPPPAPPRHEPEVKERTSSDPLSGSFPLDPDRQGFLGDRPARPEIMEQLGEWSKGWGNLPSPLRNSLAVRQAMEDLQRQMLDRQVNGHQLGGNGASLDAQLDHLNRNVPWGRAWLEKSWQATRQLDWPARLPEVDWQPFSPSWTGPPLDIPRGRVLQTGGPEVWRGLLWVAVIGCVAVLLWKLWSWHAEAGLNRKDAGWRLGPWPIDPGTVTTRNDLIRAFEYLSLLRFGLAARSWNHVAIAGRLGGEEGERRRAAAHLAALYEQARYAPTEEALTAEALAAARRDLCFLAGVAAV